MLLISIYNGRSRQLGEITEVAYMKTNVAFRDFLSLFKGSKLAVFTAIALHSDEQGWSHPSIPTLCRETGYCRDSIFDALDDLCRLTIDGHRVLLYHQPRKEDGAFKPNHYLVFPTSDEIALYEPEGSPAHRVDLLPCRKNIDTVESRHDKTSTQRRTICKEEPITKKNQSDDTHT